MIRKIYIASLTLLLLGCNNSDEIKILNQKIVEQGVKNDSLQNILDTLKTKFIFDNAFVKHIPNENKPIKPGEIYSGEFYIVAYNVKDIVLFSNEKNADKFDTLTRKGAAYVYEAKANKGINYFTFRPQIIDSTAKEFRNSFLEVIIKDDWDVTE